MAGPLASATFAEGKKPTQATVGGPIGRIGQNNRPVSEKETTANNETDAGIFGGLMGAHEAGDAVHVRDC